MLVPPSVAFVFVTWRRRLFSPFGTIVIVLLPTLPSGPAATASIATLLVDGTIVNGNWTVAFGSVTVGQRRELDAVAGVFTMEPASIRLAPPVSKFENVTLPVAFVSSILMPVAGERLRACELERDPLGRDGEVRRRPVRDLGTGLDRERERAELLRARVEHDRRGRQEVDRDEAAEDQHDEERDPDPDRDARCGRAASAGRRSAPSAGSAAAGDHPRRVAVVRSLAAGLAVRCAVTLSAAPPAPAASPLPGPHRADSRRPVSGRRALRTRRPTGGPAIPRPARVPVPTRRRRRSRAACRAPWPRGRAAGS